MTGKTRAKSADSGREMPCHSARWLASNNSDEAQSTWHSRVVSPAVSWSRDPCP